MLVSTFHKAPRVFPNPTVDLAAVFLKQIKVRSASEVVLDFEGLGWLKYATLHFVWHAIRNIESGVGVNFGFRLSEDRGVTWVTTTDYYYIQYHRYQSNVDTHIAAGLASTGGYIMQGVQDGLAAYPYGYAYGFSNLTALPAGRQTTFISRYNNTWTAPAVLGGTSRSTLQTTNQVNALKLGWGALEWDMNFSVYGMK